MDTWALPILHNERCTGCGKCENYCPTNAVHLLESRPVIGNPDACTYCGICEEVCPAGAIELFFYISRE